MPLHSTDPQLGPAMALVALRTEFPHLTPASWSLHPDGYLSGTVHDPDAFDAYVEALGGKPLGRHQLEREGVIRESDHLFTTWHDVKITLWVSYIVGVAPVLKAVA